MPYLNELRKAQLSTEKGIQDTDLFEGDLNYLYTIAMLKEWLKPGNQRYHVIHALKLASRDPYENEFVGEIEDLLTKLDVSADDRDTARELAFTEFYRRVGAPYEEYCIAKNGDVHEFEKAEQLLNEKFASKES